MRLGIPWSPPPSPAPFFLGVSFKRRRSVRLHPLQHAADVLEVQGRVRASASKLRSEWLAPLARSKGGDDGEINGQKEASGPVFGCPAESLTNLLLVG